MACIRCEHFSQRLDIDTSSQYQNIVRQLIDFVDQGLFALMQADCPLQDVLSTPFPGDVLTHIFQCSNCGETFQLWADTYHGGANWKASSST